MSKPPVDFCLVKVPHPIPEGEKCEHNTGQWLVLWEGVYYSIQPPSQLQKDIWLGDARRKIGKKAEQCLRWLCHTCGTIQFP